MATHNKPQAELQCTMILKVTGIKIINNDNLLLLIMIVVTVSNDCFDGACFPLTKLIRMSATDRWRAQKV